MRRIGNLRTALFLARKSTMKGNKWALVFRTYDKGNRVTCGVIERSKLWHLVGGSFFPIFTFFVPKEVLLITLQSRFLVA